MVEATHTTRNFAVNFLFYYFFIILGGYLGEWTTRGPNPHP